MCIFDMGNKFSSEYKLTIAALCKKKMLNGKTMKVIKITKNIAKMTIARNSKIFASQES